MTIKFLKAKVNLDVLFVSSGEGELADARYYLEQEMERGGGLFGSEIMIEEIKEMSQVPDSWKNAIVWNCEALNLFEAKPKTVLREIEKPTEERLLKELEILDAKVREIKDELDQRLARQAD